MNKLFTSMGGSREVAVANILQDEKLWANYEQVHEEKFLESGLKKHVTVNQEGVIVARNSDKKLHANANGALRHEDFLVIQDKVLEVRRRKLNGIADLMAAGLSFGVDIGEQLVGFENINEFQEAEQEMNPDGTYQNNDTSFGVAYVPNPITHQSFSVPWRQKGFDYKRSLGMTEAIRQVSEKLEDMLFNGNTSIVANFNGANQPLYGYTTHPDRGTGTISDWTLTTAAGLAAIVPETVEQVGLMFSAQGGVSNDSVVMYVANDIWTNLQNDYKVESTDTAGSGMMVVERIKKIAQIKDVKPAEKLAAGQVMLVEMEERTIQLAIASDVIAVPHQETSPMMPQVMTIYAAMVPQIKSDSNNNTGIRHLTV